MKRPVGQLGRAITTHVVLKIFRRAPDEIIKKKYEMLQRGTQLLLTTRIW